MRNSYQRRSILFKHLSHRWGSLEIILATISLIAILSIGSGLFGKWLLAAREAGFLPVSLHAIGKADYSVDDWLKAVSPIAMDVLELFGINVPRETENGGFLSDNYTSTPTTISASYTPTPTTLNSSTPTPTV
jgi:hypothetical protein